MLDHWVSIPKRRLRRSRPESRRPATIPRRLSSHNSCVERTRGAAHISKVVVVTHNTFKNWSGLPSNRIMRANSVSDYP